MLDKETKEKKNYNKTLVMFKLSKEKYDKLDILAKKKGVSVNLFVKDIINKL